MAAAGGGLVIKRSKLEAGRMLLDAARDCVCVQVPMFHANCFGMSHAAAMVGAKLVDLLAERVTVSGGVPTIRQLVAADLRACNVRLPDLRL